MYVDDTIAAYHKDDNELWNRIKSELHQSFPLKDLGPAGWILHVEIKRDRKHRKIHLCQQAYIKMLVDRYYASSQHKTNNCAMTIDFTDKKMYDRELNALETVQYRSIIGALLYAAQQTRPDIAWVVGALGRYNQSPCVVHMKAAMHVLHYLQTTNNLVLSIKSHSKDVIPPIEIYVDSDWAGDKTDRKSTTGLVVLVDKSPVSWQSSKQRSISLSSTEAETIALSEACKEAAWYHKLISELYDTCKPIKVYVDNKPTIDIAEGKGSHDKSKHIAVRDLYAQECVENRIVKLVWIPTKQQLADFLTKRLPTDQLQTLRNCIMETI